MGNTFGFAKREIHAPPAKPFNNWSKLAPKEPLGDSDGSGSECPICFLNFQFLNVACCCKQAICTKCFVEYVTAEKFKDQSSCPFCSSSRFDVRYSEQSVHVALSSPSEKGIPIRKSASPMVFSSVSDRKELEGRIRCQHESESLRRHSEPQFQRNGGYLNARQRHTEFVRRNNDYDPLRDLLLNLSGGISDSPRGGSSRNNEIGPVGSGSNRQGRLASRLVEQEEEEEADTSFLRSWNPRSSPSAAMFRRQREAERSQRMERINNDVARLEEFMVMQAIRMSLAGDEGNNGIDNNDNNNNNDSSSSNNNNNDNDLDRGRVSSSSGTSSSEDDRLSASWNRLASRLSDCSNGSVSLSELSEEEQMLMALSLSMQASSLASDNQPVQRTADVSPTSQPPPPPAPPVADLIIENSALRLPPLPSHSSPSTPATDASSAPIISPESVSDRSLSTPFVSVESLPALDQT